MANDAPESQTARGRSFSHKRALLNLLGVHDDARGSVSYTCTPPPVAFVDRTPPASDEEVEHGERTRSRRMMPEPRTAEIQAQAVTAADTALEPQADAGATPRTAPRQDEREREMVLASTPRIVPVPAPERADRLSVAKAVESESSPHVAQAYQFSGDARGILRPAIERSPRLDTVAQDQPPAIERRAPSAEPPPTRPRVEPRRHLEYATAGDSAAIEHLRRTVKELAGRLAQSHGRAFDALPGAPPQPAPATVAPAAPARAGMSRAEQFRGQSFRRAARSAPARAFWQRNYLRRRSL